MAREMEERVRTEQTAQQMAAHRDSSPWEKVRERGGGRGVGKEEGFFWPQEVRRLTRAKRQLEEEVRRLEETMASSMVDRSVMDTAVSRAEDQVTPPPLILSLSTSYDMPPISCRHT